MGTIRKNIEKYINSLGNLMLNDLFDKINITQQIINNGTFSPNNLSAGSKIHEIRKKLRKINSVLFIVTCHILIFSLLKTIAEF